MLLAHRPWLGRVAASLAVLGLLGCTAGQSGDAAPAKKEQGRPADPPAARGPQYAPEFELEDLDGKVVRLSDYAGQVRLVDFWATWCLPCIEEIPVFKELHREYGDKGFVLIAVATDDDGVSEVRPFVEKHAIPYANLIADDDVLEAYDVFAMPTQFLVDREGRIVDKWIGVKSRKQLENQIRQLLGLEPVARDAA